MPHMRVTEKLSPPRKTVQGHRDTAILRGSRRTIQAVPHSIAPSLAATPRHNRSARLTSSTLAGNHCLHHRPNRLTRRHSKACICGRTAAIARQLASTIVTDLREIRTCVRILPPGGTGRRFLASNDLLRVRACVV